MSEDAAVRTDRRAGLALALIEGVLLGPLTLTAHSRGLEPGFLALLLLLLPFHVRRVLALCGRAPKPPVWTVLIEIVAMLSLARDPVSPLGPWIALLAFPLHITAFEETRRPERVERPLPMTLGVALVLTLAVLLLARARGLRDLSILCYDESLYLVQGMSWAQGLLPGRDTWVNKPPLVPLVFAWSYELFGANVLPPRVLCLLSLLATSGLAVLLVARAHGTRAAIAAAVAVACLSSTRISPEDTIPALSEALHVFPLTLTLVLLLVPRPPRLTLAASTLAGLALGAATLIRQNGLVFVPLAAGVALLPPARASWAGGARSLLAFGLGFVLSFVPVVVYFQLEGGLRELLAQTWTGPRMHHRFAVASLWWPGLRFLGDFLLSHLLLSGLALLGIASAARDLFAREGLEDRVFPATTVVWFALSACSCVLGGRFYPHYLPMLAPAMGVLVGMGVGLLERLVALPAFGRARAIALVAMSLAFLVDVGLACDDMALRASPEAWPGHERRSDTERGPLLARIRELTRPGERIFFLGSCPGLYFRSERSPAAPDLAGEAMAFARVIPGFSDRTLPGPDGSEETLEQSLTRNLARASLVLEPELRHGYFSGQCAEQWNPDPQKYPQLPAVVRCLEERFVRLPGTVEGVRIYARR